MKGIKKFLQVMSAICVMILLLTSVAFASPEINVVSEEEAVEMALFYYCLNAINQEIVQFDSYVITPLYNEKGAITYYCVDFFYQEEGRGYVLIGANLTYAQCPEMYTEGVSPYRKEVLQGNEIIYFSPMELYVVEDDCLTYDVVYQEVNLAEIDGNVCKGDIFQNRTINQMTRSSTPSDMLQKKVFWEHPITYLESLGYTGAYTDGYATIQDDMSNAGALNYMYNFSDTVTAINLATDFTLRNPNHCVITATSNILMYWRYKGFTNFPSTYQKMFVQVAKNAEMSLLFSRNGITGINVTHDNMLSLLRMTSAQLDYTQRIFRSNEDASWSFLYSYLDSRWPVALGFNEPSSFSPFAYASHQTVAVGYNKIRCSKGNQNYYFRFVKVFDGWSNSGLRYISWDMIESCTNSNTASPMRTFMWTYRPAPV